MNDLVTGQQMLPEVHIPQRYLMKPLARMEYITLLSRLATNVLSDAYVYGNLKLITTIGQVELLKQASNGQLSPEAEEACRRLAADYMEAMEAIPQQIAARLLEELQKVPEDMDNQGFLARLRALLSG